MKIVEEIDIADLNKMAANFFGNMVKAVVDIEKNIIALDAELHSDLEALLLEDGSRQNDLWGINLYPKEDENFLEFDSMINIRPSQNNFSRDIEDEEVRKKISDFILKRVKR